LIQSRNSRAKVRWRIPRELSVEIHKGTLTMHLRGFSCGKRERERETRKLWGGDNCAIIQIIWINCSIIISLRTLHSRTSSEIARMKWTAQSRGETRCSNFNFAKIYYGQILPVSRFDSVTVEINAISAICASKICPERFAGVYRADRYSWPNTPGNPSRSKDTKVTGTTL